MPKDNETNGGTSGTQPPPPVSDGSDQTPWTPGGKESKHEQEMTALEAVYFQLMEMRRTLDKMEEEARQEKIRRKMGVVPVRTSDLLRGFQAAVARANRSTQAGEGDSEDIERMSVKDLEVSLSAPIIEGGHAADPVIMLPNIKSVDEESAKISLKFSVVSVPLKR